MRKGIAISISTRTISENGASNANADNPMAAMRALAARYSRMNTGAFYQ